MNRRLFIVCPFANLEYLLKQQFGNDSLFLSVPAGLVHASDNIFLDNLKAMVAVNCINEIYVVNEVSNPIVTSIINNEYKRDITCLNPVADLKEEYWLEKFAGLSKYQQTLKMAELMAEQSMELIRTVFASTHSSTILSVTIKGIVISKEAGFIKELKRMNRYKIAYGL